VTLCPFVSPLADEQIVHDRKQPSAEA
jgi:hypothetical protein